MRALALLYHDVVAPGEFETSGFTGPGTARYKLDRGEFEAHLSAIARARGGEPMPVFDISKAAPDPPPFLLTFDDGGVSASTHISGSLDQRGWRGHFFVPTDWIGKPRFLDENQIRELRGRGHVIGSHSCSHPERMSRCNWSQLVDEWSRSVKTLSDILGEPVTTASVPGGYYSKRVAGAASAAGIRFLFNSEPVSRCTQVADCTVLGRYGIFRGTPAETAAAFATGRPGPRARQWVFWTVKKMAKAMGGELWLNMRKRILRNE